MLKSYKNYLNMLSLEANQLNLPLSILITLTLSVATVFIAYASYFTGSLFINATNYFNNPITAKLIISALFVAFAAVFIIASPIMFYTNKSLFNRLKSVFN